MIRRNVRPVFNVLNPRENNENYFSKNARKKRLWEQNNIIWTET